jgi:hypothetical protein
MDIVIGLPESSLRGFCIACAGFAAEGLEVVASARRGMRCVKALEKVVLRCGEGRDLWLRPFGARKSRYSGLDAVAAVALLYALVNVCLDAALLVARKQAVHIVYEEAIVKKRVRMASIRKGVFHKARSLKDAGIRTRSPTIASSSQDVLARLVMRPPVEPLAPLCSQSLTRHMAASLKVLRHYISCLTPPGTHIYI